MQLKNCSDTFHFLIITVMGHRVIIHHQAIIGKTNTPMKTTTIITTKLRRLRLPITIIHGVESLSLRFGTIITTITRTPTPMEISSIAVIMTITITCTIKIRGEVFPTFLVSGRIFSMRLKKSNKSSIDHLEI